MKRKAGWLVVTLAAVSIMAAGCNNKKADTDVYTQKVTYQEGYGTIEGKGLSYKLDKKKKTAVVESYSDMTIEKVKIPDLLSYKDKEYKVTGIAESAFESNTGMKQLKMVAPGV